MDKTIQTAIAIKQIKERLAEIEADERIHYEPANVYVNAPLALVQVNLGTEKRTLEWVLNLLEVK